jgi:NADP-dependent 3-hydroxy acid dehydrogenase YdfG
MDMKEKVVWITGSSRGIGKATARALAAAGAKVVISARKQQTIQQIAESIQAEGGSALAVQCDVQKNADILQLVEQTRETWGPIDILINNAGIGIFKKIVETQESDWNAMMDTNLKAAFLCTKAVLPEMQQRRQGRIINIVSVAGLQAYPNGGGYCASKFGLRGFSDVLRLETREYGIKVTSICPGATSTDIWGDANVDHAVMIRPEDVADAILSVCQAGDSAHIEELVMRPQNGDL